MEQLMQDKTRRELLFKEIDLVQKIIDRVANNSFLIKGWATTLIVASLLLSGTSYYHFAAFLPWLVFWYLDAFFLHTEKLYRALYNWLVENRPKSNEFPLDLDPESLKKRFPEVKTTKRLMFSKTLLAFYGLLFVIILVVIIVDLILPQKALSTTPAQLSWGFAGS
jgi:hypothetical protein